MSVNLQSTPNAMQVGNRDADAANMPIRAVYFGQPRVNTAVVAPQAKQTVFKLLIYLFPGQALKRIKL